MNLTLGFIAFFISIVIPGLIFRRFYFYGEFSKQYNTKDPVLHSVFFSIIPGVFIQLIGFVIYHYLFGFKSEFINIFTIFRDITSDGSNGTNDITISFINNDIITFFVYSLSVFLLSVFLGYTTSRLIRKLGLDKKYKIFRFKNQWYYIFSGELLNMKKFKEAHKISFNIDGLFEQDVSVTYADILVSVNEDKRELYTGYVVDYDLKAEDTTKLDKVYLLDTYRYKRKKSDHSIDNMDNTPISALSRSQKKIPGDVFVLNADNIINLNLTYIPSKIKIKAKADAIKERKQRRLESIRTVYFMIFISLILVHFFYKLFDLENTFFGKYMDKVNVLGNIFTILFVSMTFSWLVPNPNKEGELVYDLKKDFKFRLIFYLIIGATTIWFWWRHL